MLRSCFQLTTYFRMLPMVVCRLNTSFSLLTYFWISLWSLNYKVFQFGPINLLPFTILVISVSIFQNLLTSFHMSVKIGDQRLNLKSTRWHTVDSQHMIIQQQLFFSLFLETTTISSSPSTISSTTTINFTNGNNNKNNKLDIKILFTPYSSI